jgi:K+-transporting ATPase A subunit
MGPAGPQGPQGPTGVLSAVTKYSTTVSNVGNATWQDLPGATVTVTVPANTQAMVVARFSSQGSTCSRGTCLMRILVDGTEAAPALGNNSTWTGYMERVLGPLGPGAHTVKVQYGNKSGVTTRLNGWVLSAYLAQAG